MKTGKTASRRMMVFTGTILLVGLAIAGTYIFVFKPGDPGGKTIMAPLDGASNPPSH